MEGENFQQPTSRAIGELCMEPNEHLNKRMMTSISSSGDNVCYESSTELDSHANMVVIGKQAFVLSHSGQYENVRAFTDEFKGIPKVPIMDAVIAYDCLQSGQTYLLVARNALCIPSMEHNLITPFILREAGLVLHDTPKIHSNVTSAEDQSMFDEETRLRIPFTLDRNFSVFKSRSLTNEEINNVEDFETVFLTPDSNKWDPYDKSYKHN